MLSDEVDIGVRSRTAATMARSRRPRQAVRYLVLVDAFVVLAAAALAATATRMDASDPRLPAWLAVTVGGSLNAFSFYRLYERDRGQLVVSSLDEWHDFLD